MDTNNYYSPEAPHTYTHSLDYTPGSLPPEHALRGPAPEARAGYWPCARDGAWVYLEDHRGKKGYVDGKPATVEKLGPLPQGWSETPPLPSLEETRAAKLEEVMSAYQAAFSEVDKVYPQAEREGWAVQEAEARAVLADPEAETPVLSVLVELRARGETMAELAENVLEKAAAWRELYARLTGQQQRMYAEVEALEDVEAVLAYTVDYVVT